MHHVKGTYLRPQIFASNPLNIRGLESFNDKSKVDVSLIPHQGGAAYSITRIATTLKTLNLNHLLPKIALFQSLFS